MSLDDKLKSEIFEKTIKTNIKRKSIFVDKVEFVNNIPLFSWLDINPTELCNRRCVFCPRADMELYPNQNLHISLDLCSKIADELRSLKYTGGVALSGYGEPTLHPDFVEVVKIFGKDIRTELITSGDFLTPQSVADLYDAGISQILVSLYDGPHQLDHFRQIFSEANVPESHYFLRDRWYTMDSDFGVKLTNRAGTVLEGNQIDVEENKPCFYTHYSMSIDWNGDVLLCVQDWNKKTKMGNLNHQSLMEVWTSSNFNKYRRSLGNGKRALMPCKNCNTDGTLHGTDHREGWLNHYKNTKD
jgi:radical SAM protein with 4Fe4S-binding SPASM domain